MKTLIVAMGLCLMGTVSQADVVAVVNSVADAKNAQIVDFHAISNAPTGRKVPGPNPDYPCGGEHLSYECGKPQILVPETAPGYEFVVKFDSAKNGDTVAETETLRTLSTGIRYATVTADQLPGLVLPKDRKSRIAKANELFKLVPSSMSADVDGEYPCRITTEGQPAGPEKCYDPYTVTSYFLEIVRK